MRDIGNMLVTFVIIGMVAVVGTLGFGLYELIKWIL